MRKLQKDIFPDGELWIGLAKVEQLTRNGVLGDADQAYTNALAVAQSRSAFRSKVRKALAELGLELKRLEDAETWDARTAKHTVDDELRKIAREAGTNASVRFGTFHAFDV
jgi:hypothetical protein